MTSPLTNGPTKHARDRGGRFAKGNSGGPGNPFVHRVAQWRQQLADTVKDEDVEAVVAQLIKAARAGEQWAIREFLDRLMGKAKTQIEIGPPEVERTCEDILNEIHANHPEFMNYVPPPTVQVLPESVNGNNPEASK